jgi:hypothetical protein
MDFAPVMGPAKYGIDASAPASNAPTALASTVTPSERAAAASKALSLQNPLTVWVGVAAVVFGLMAFSTSVRVGHTTAALSLGDTK